jgi:hypothetical protein
MKSNPFGIFVNHESELKNDLIKKDLGHLPNAEQDLFVTEFVTVEKSRKGNDLINGMFAAIDKDIQDGLTA